MKHTMNLLPTICIAIFSFIPGSFVWWFIPGASLLKGSFAITVSLYTFALTILGADRNDSSIILKRFAFTMGHLCPASLALLCLERFGTLHGTGIWIILWSFLVLGFGFGHWGFGRGGFLAAVDIRVVVPVRFGGFLRSGLIDLVGEVDQHQKRDDREISEGDFGRNTDQAEEDRAERLLLFRFGQRQTGGS